MQPIKKSKNYKVKESFLTYFLEKYWFIPSDVLQRGIEANVWELCNFKRPILDIGIGNGQMSNYIFKNSPQIDVGIDSEESGLESAKKTEKYVRVLRVNAENMPFKSAAFNTVVSNSTFEHIINDFKAVSEVGRVLKKGGLFFTTVPSEYLEKWVMEFDGENNLAEFNRRANHLHYRSLNVWKQYLQKNNLEIIFYKYYFPKEATLFWYKLFKLFTAKFGSREWWSIIGDSGLSKFLPKKIIRDLLKNILKSAYKKGFFINSGKGAQLFMIAKKIQ